MLKKIIASLMMLAVMFMATLSFAAPAQATGGNTPSPNNKQVTLCHWTGEDDDDDEDEGGYDKITVSVSDFVKKHSKHSKDIWDTFTYVTKGGQTVTVPAQGNTDLLAFEDCKLPKVDEQIVVPHVQVVDKCETKDDKVLVPESDKYTYKVTYNNNVATVVFTAAEGFVFAEGKTVTKTFTFTNNEDCDLPETGSEAQFFVLGGVLALLGMAVAGTMMYRIGRQTV